MMNTMLKTYRNYDLIKRSFSQFCVTTTRSVTNYVQGQYIDKKSREYFYYIDHQGQLFLDDAKVKNFISCFQDKEFLAFFFRRVRMNNTGRHEKEFPYVSPCGREKNYIRCEDLPIVFTNLIKRTNENDDAYYLSCNNTGDKVTVLFSPEKLCMLPESARVYHPAGERVGGIGLVKSKLAIELSQYFGYDSLSETNDYEDIPCTFTWEGVTYTLTQELLKKATKSD